MTKELKRFRVNGVIKINFPIYVMAEDEDEAIDKCEDNFGDYSLNVYSDTCGVKIPDDEYDDDDCTRVFEMEDYEIEAWSDFEFSVDEYNEPEIIELEYSEDEEDDDEEDDDES